MYHVTAIALAYVIDLLVGDPKNWPHPVRWMGTYISFVDKRMNKGKYRKLKGLCMLLSLLIIVFTISFTVTLQLYQWHPIAGIIIEALFIATTISQKSLKDAALDVLTPLQTGNTTEAREKLAYIVGRDTDHLSETEIVRSTVETVAENTADGITAPLFWAFIGGAPLALVYRAVNTCDSMVGYKNDTYKEFGWASARFDDAVNWIPARISAFITMFTMQPEGSPFTEAWTILFRDAPKHNSPNSGWGEASVAALLGIQLGGTNFYQGIKSASPLIGEPIHPLQTSHVTKTIAIMQRTVFFFTSIIFLGGIVYELAVTWL